MANNRIYLRCKHCGELLYLGKTFGGEYYYMNYKDDESLDCKINRFYTEHSWCDKEKNEKDIKYIDTPLGYDGHNDNIFEIAYEIENDELVKKEEQLNEKDKE